MSNIYRASPSFTFTCEMDFACTYALRNPLLARECAARALSAAIAGGRPDLAYQANSFLALL